MQDDVCKYFKYGYCKYRDKCRMHHNKEICDNGYSCTASKVCPKRHPKLCRKLSLEGFCRHGDKCAYRHTTSSKLSIQNDANILKVRLENLENVVQEMAKQIATLQSELFYHEEATLESNSITVKDK